MLKTWSFCDDCTLRKSLAFSLTIWEMTDVQDDKQEGKGMEAEATLECLFTIAKSKIKSFPSFVLSSDVLFPKNI